MDFFEERKNRQFDLMLTSIRDRIKQSEIDEICRNGQISFHKEKNELCFQSMHHEVTVAFPDIRLKPELEMWYTLTLLQYLETADGTPLSGEMISLSQMRGGLSRGHGYEKHIETMCIKELPQVTSEAFKAACEAIGGRVIPSRADVSVVIDFAPRFPIMINFWEADDEYPMSVKMLVDSMADHYLGIEAAGAACLTVFDAIADQIRRSQSAS